MLVVCVPHAEAYRVRLAWRPVPGVSGYKLYARQNGYPTPTVIDIGQPAADSAGMLHYEHSGLLVESTNIFSLVSYNSARVESAPSNELSVGYAVAATIVDSDGDGLTDAREDKNLDLTRQTTETDRLRADTDGDGTSDGAEVSAGSDPLNAASRPGPDPTPTRTATPARTATRTATPLPTATRTATPLPTATRTTTPPPTTTRTATPQPTRTVTPLPTATRTAAPALTPTATTTPRRTTTATPTSVRTATVQPSSTRTVTPPPSTTPTPRPTFSPTRTVLATVTPPPATSAPLPTATPFGTGELQPPIILSVERVD